MPRRVLAPVAVALLMSACSARSNITDHRASPAPRHTAVQVIKAWSDALRRGDIDTAAGYFALPSRMINSSSLGEQVVIPIRTRRQAVAANEALPCGAVFVSARQLHSFVDALFSLTSRPGRGGGGIGCVGPARTFFVVVGGRIVDWIRAPLEPGDSGTPSTSV